MIKKPKGRYFRLQLDNRKDSFQIAPGLNIEFTVTLEVKSVEDYTDSIEITSENGLCVTLEMRALKSQPIIHFEPFLNFGFVPVGTKKTAEIQFENEGSSDSVLEFVFEKSGDLRLDKANLFIPANSREKRIEGQKKSSHILSVTFDAKEAVNLHTKIELIQNHEGTTKKIGFIEVIGTAVYQQLSLVFEEGGGQNSEINFGVLYYGQLKECSAFLVNNGPKEIAYKVSFYPNKNSKEALMEDDDLVLTPADAGKEMTERILSATPIFGTIKPYTQVPMRFLCKTKIYERKKGWQRDFLLEKHEAPELKNYHPKKNFTVPPESYKSTAVIKFDLEKRDSSNLDEKVAAPVITYMEVNAIYPQLVLDKTTINFWEVNLKETAKVTLVLKNESDELPLDYKFKKIPHFTVTPNEGVIEQSGKETIEVYFHPENYGNFNDILTVYYVNGIYSYPIRVMGFCKKIDLEKVFKNKNSKIRGPELYGSNFNKHNEVMIIKPEKAENYTVRKQAINALDRLDHGLKIREVRKLYLQDVPNQQVFKEYCELDEQKYRNFIKAKSNYALREFRMDRIRDENPKEVAVMGNVAFSDLKLELPESNESLFVTKHIGNYVAL